MADDDRFARLERGLREADNRARDAVAAAERAAHKVESHEEVCAERYNGLGLRLDTITDALKSGRDRFKRIEWIIIAGLVALLGAGDAVEVVSAINGIAGGG